MTVLAWLESTGVARAVSGSLSLTAGLSAAHLLGFTVLYGAALVLHLRLVGATLRRAALPDVVQTARLLAALGLAVSIATGALLFAGRATSIAANGIFQAKMSLLVLAVLWQIALQRRLARTTALSRHAERAIGFAGLTLWLCLAVTACAFILLE
jgi:hypothetical protein